MGQAADGAAISTVMGGGGWLFQRQKSIRKTEILTGTSRVGTSLRGDLVLYIEESRKQVLGFVCNAFFRRGFRFMGQLVGNAHDDEPYR